METGGGPPRLLRWGIETDEGRGTADPTTHRWGYVCATATTHLFAARVSGPRGLPYDPARGHHGRGLRRGHRPRRRGGGRERRVVRRRGDTGGLPRRRRVREEPPPLPGRGALALGGDLWSCLVLRWGRGDAPARLG